MSFAGLGLALRPPHKPSASQPQFHGLEDDEELLLHDLESEQFFGREYDLLDKHDNTIDYLD